MTRLTCPHCGQPLAANPLGHWFAHFQCPHCHKMLQFDARTNITGVAGSAFFFIMAWALIGERSEFANATAALAGTLWVLAIGVSYGLRRVVKG